MTLQKLVNCLECEEWFLDVKKLRKHKKSHIKSSEEFDLQNAVHKISPHNCKQCGKCFKSQFALKRHVQSFHEGVRYKCDKCGKEFTRTDSLSDHKKRLH